MQAIGTLRELGAWSAISHVAMAAIQSAKLPAFKGAEDALAHWAHECQQIATANAARTGAGNGKGEPQARRTPQRPRAKRNTVRAS